MKIHLLTFMSPSSTSSSYLTSMNLLHEAAEKQGHELEVVYARKCILSLAKSRPRIFVGSKDITKDIRCMIVRPSFNGTNISLHLGILKQFELAGVKLLNNHDSILFTKNKVRTLQILKDNNIPIPKTYIVRSPEFLENVIKKDLKFPIILKTLAGAAGIGVAICESKRSLDSLIEMIVRDEDGDGPLIVQEYIRESTGKDIRIFVVGNKIVAAMERIAANKSEFRSNFSKGGNVKIAELSTKEKRMAIKAANVCKVDVAGVDLIRSKKGPQILEVNSNPGLEGITKATKKDVAGAIIAYAVKKAKRLRR